jgi:hypothetical protein
VIQKDAQFYFWQHKGLIKDQKENKQKTINAFSIGVGRVRCMKRETGYETLDEFDELLLKIIDKTLRYVVGERNTLTIYNRLEESSCPMQEIPRRLGLFSTVLRNLLGTGRGQMLGASATLEDAIVKALSLELGLKSEKKSTGFEDRVRSLKDRCNKRQGKRRNLGGS